MCREDREPLRRDPQAAAYVQEYAAELAQNIPAVMYMDYAAFYDGTHEDIAAKYRLAWSIASRWRED